MDLYILDPLIRRHEVVDDYETLIWTDRWREAGDFELDLRSTRNNRIRFSVDSLLAIRNSNRVMMVEDVEDTLDSENKEILKVRGRSIEGPIFENRIVKYSMGNLSTDEKWILTDLPADIIRNIFDHICRPVGALSSNDEIPFLMPGSISSPTSIPEPGELITLEIEPSTMYEVFTNICESYDLGYRIVRNGDASELYFEVYTGDDRTTKQTDRTQVIFGAWLDNIQNTTEFVNNKETKNVVYAFSNTHSVVVYADGVSENVSGFQRRVMVLKESDANLARLTQLANEELKKHRKELIFDGEVDEYSGYQYGVNYNLGDLVEMRSKDGVVSTKRVTEQIFVSDENGIRSYPTLTEEETDILTTWSSLKNDNLSWNDLDSEVWDDY